MPEAERQDEDKNIISALIRNGVEFLQKSLDDFSKHPMHAMVHFWTGLEILLKVPLAHEHWTLVSAGKPITRARYLSGDFQSVSFEETCDRLRDILGREVPSDAMKIFNAVRHHRNRIVHFYASRT